MRTMSRISSSDLPSVPAVGWAGAAAAGADWAGAGVCVEGPCAHEVSVRDAASNDANTVMSNGRFIVVPRSPLEVFLHILVADLRTKQHPIRIHHDPLRCSRVLGRMSI